MGKSSKKSKVAAATVSVPTPQKSAKKGKREANEALTKQVSAKKIKFTQVHLPKKEETSNSEDTSSSSEEDVKPSGKTPMPVKIAIGDAIKNVSVPKKNVSSTSSESDSDSDSDENVKAPAESQKVSFTKKKQSSSSSSSESDSDSDSDEDVKPAAKAPLAKKPMLSTQKESSGGSESDSDSDSDEDIKPAAKAPPVKKPMVLTKTESSSSSESDSDSDSDEDVKPAAKAPPTKQPVIPTKKEISSSSESGSDSDSDEGESSESDDEPQTKKLKTLTTPVGAQVDDSSDEDDSCDESEEVDEKSLKNRSRAEANVSAPKSSGKPEKNSAKTAIAAKTLPSGSTTLFVGNLSFSIEREHLEEFFKDAGEVVDIRFASNEDGQFRGFGHVQFTSEFSTKKAMELNGRELLGRAVRLEIAHERGTPGALRERPFQKPNRGTIFVKGFNKCLDEEQVRNNLREHFGECGEIGRISIPTDHESGAMKGFAYIDFASTDSFSKALELNGSELEGYTLTVDEASPGGGGGRSGGRGYQDRGDRFSGSRGGGRFPDGRGGRFGGRGGGRGGRGVGRGRTNRSNFVATGKKITFEED